MPVNGMHATDYAPRFPANATEPLLCQLLQQLGTTHRKAMTWMGALKQVLCKQRIEMSVLPKP
jgi:hypothetical protein